MDGHREQLKFYSDGVDRFIVITVATEENDELQRFRNSCTRYNIPYLVLGLGDDWKSGRAVNGVLLERGGAQKIIYLRDEIKKWKNLRDTIILFTDSYDVMFNGGPEEIIAQFRNMKSPVVFSTEKTCWPDESISEDYPDTESSYKYLNSGGFIGYGDHIIKMVNTDIKIDDDDQRFYTDYFLNSGNEIPEKEPLKEIKQNTYEQHSNGSPFGWMSETYFDDEILKYVSSNYGQHIKMLDIGAGDGKWARVLGSHVRHIDAVEIFEPYIERYNLKELYNNIHLGDFLTYDFKEYDLVVMGDVFEHVTQEQAFNWLTKVRDKVSELIIVVPFEYLQDWDGVYENVYGHHHQPDLTPMNMLERYPMLRLVRWTDMPSTSNEGTGFGWYSWKETDQTINKNIKLDYKQTIFQTLNESLDDVQLNMLEGKLSNLSSKSTPLVIHANGPSYIKDYLWEINDTMLGLNLYKKEINEINDKSVLLNVILDRPVNDTNQVFDQIRYIDYPKKNIFINIIYGDHIHEYKIKKFIEEFGDEYIGVDMTFENDGQSIRRDLALKKGSLSKMDYTLIMDCNYIFRNRKSLQRLLGEDKKIITPMIVSEGTEWVNFFFSVDSSGYLVQKEEQEKIKTYGTQGIWSVGSTSGVWLIDNSIIDRIQNAYSKNIRKFNEDDYDMAFSYTVREIGYFIYLTNKSYFGGII